MRHGSDRANTNPTDSPVALLDQPGILCGAPTHQPTAVFFDALYADDVSHGDVRTGSMVPTSHRTGANSIAFGENGNDESPEKSGDSSSFFSLLNLLCGAAHWAWDSIRDGIRAGVADYRTMSGAERVIVRWVLVSLAGLLVLGIIGCTPHTHTSTLNSVAQYQGEASGKAEVAGDLISRIRSSVPTSARPLVDAAQKAIEGITISLQRATESRAQAEHEVAKLQFINDRLAADNAQLRDAWLTHKMKMVLAIAAGIIFVLRGIGLISTGFIGKLCAFVGTGIGGVATLGVGLINSIADNLHFRWRAKTAPAVNAPADDETLPPVLDEPPPAVAQATCATAAAVSPAEQGA